jgi:O-antigen/teichoic acid export membrane protein
MQALWRYLQNLFESEFVKRIIRNSSYLVSATVIAAGMGMLQGAFQARTFGNLSNQIGLAGLGLLAAIAGFTNVLNRLTSFRIDELVIRYVRLYQERGETQKAAAVYKLAAILESLGAILAFILIVWLAPLGVSLFSDLSDVETWFILYGTLALINLVFDSSDGILKVFDRFDAKAVIEIAQSAVRLGLTILVFITGGGLLELILAELAGRLLRSVAVVWLAIRTVREKWGPDWLSTPFSVLKEDRRSLLTFAFSTNLSATISLVSKDSEDLWVNAFLGNVVGGFYNVARTLNGLLQIPVSPLPATTYPELSRAVAQKDWKSVSTVLKRGSLIASIYSLPVSTFLIVFGRSLIGLYLGPAYSAADIQIVYQALVILLLGFSFVNIFYWNRAALLSFNRPVFPTIVNFVGMLLKVSVILVFGSALGATGFAAALIGYYIFTVSLAVMRVRNDVVKNLPNSGAGT